MISSAIALASAKVGTSFPTPLKVMFKALGIARESWAFGFSPTIDNAPGEAAWAFLMYRVMEEWIPPQRPPSEVMAR